MFWVLISLAMAEDLQFDDEVPAVVVPTTYQNARWLKANVSKRVFADPACTERSQVELAIGDDPCQLTVSGSTPTLFDFSEPMTKQTLARVGYSLDLDGNCVATEGPLSGGLSAPAERVWNAVAFHAEQCGGRVEGRVFGGDAVWAREAREFASSAKAKAEQSGTVVGGMMVDADHQYALRQHRRAVTEAFEEALETPLLVHPPGCAGEPVEVAYQAAWWLPGQCELSLTTRTQGVWLGEAQQQARMEQTLDLSGPVKLGSVTVGIGDTCHEEKLARVGDGSLVVLPEPVGQGEFMSRLAAVARACGGSVELDGAEVAPAPDDVWRQTMPKWTPYQVANWLDARLMRVAQEQRERFSDASCSESKTVWLDKPDWSIPCTLKMARGEAGGELGRQVEHSFDLDLSTEIPMSLVRTTLYVKKGQRCVAQTSTLGLEAVDVSDTDQVLAAVATMAERCGGRVLDVPDGLSWEPGPGYLGDRDPNYDNTGISFSTRESKE